MEIIELVYNLADLLVKLIDGKLVIFFGCYAWLWERYASDEVGVYADDRLEDGVYHLLVFLGSVERCGYTLGKQFGTHNVDGTFQISFATHSF